MSNHFKVSPFIEEIDVSSYEDRLYITLKDRDTLIKIRNKQILSLLIPISYATCNELYNNGKMISDFCKEEFDNVTVKDFRERYKRKFTSVKFGYTQYLGATPEWALRNNPNWDIDKDNPDYFSLTWEPKDVY